MTAGLRGRNGHGRAETPERLSQKRLDSSNPPDRVGGLRASAGMQAGAWR